MSIQSNLKNRENKDNAIHLLDNEKAIECESKNIPRKCDGFIKKQGLKKTIIEIPIEMEDGVVQRILVSKDQNPQELVNQFCIKYKISKNLMPLFRHLAIKKIEEAQKILNLNLTEKKLEIEDEILEDEQKINNVASNSKLLNENLPFSQTIKDFNLLSSFSNHNDNTDNNNNNILNNTNNENDDNSTKNNINEVKEKIIFASSHFGDEDIFEKVQDENETLRNNFYMMLTCDSFKDFKQKENVKQVNMI